MTDWGLGLYMNLKQAVRSKNIYSVFNVFVNNPIYPCAKNIRYIRAITSLWSVGLRQISCSKTYSSAWQIHDYR